MFKFCTELCLVSLQEQQVSQTRNSVQTGKICGFLETSLSSTQALATPWRGVFVVVVYPIKRAQCDIQPESPMPTTLERWQHLSHNVQPRPHSVLKKPNYLYSYTTKNFMKIKHSWKGNSEQARIRKKDFALGVSNCPPYHPRSSPSGFSGLSILFTYHSDSRTKGQADVWGERSGERAKHPRNESKVHQKKTVQKSVGPKVQKPQGRGWKLQFFRGQQDFSGHRILTRKILGSLVEGLGSCYSKYDFFVFPVPHFTAVKWLQVLGFNML